MNLRDLHKIATEARDAAHRAYALALKTTSDTSDAYAALLLANRVRDSLYEMIISEISKGS